MVGETGSVNTGGPGDEVGLSELGERAVAAYLGGREEESLAAWEEGHRRCTDAGDIVGGARFGVQIAQALAFKGDIARTSGWVERVRRQLDSGDVDCVELGYVEHVAAFCRIMEVGDVAGALAGFERATKIADRFGDRQLRALAHMGTGRCLIYSGELRDGLALLDEVMVSVEMGELAPVAIGDAYCTVIDACYELFDLRRCATWTLSFTSWCEANPEVVLYRGQCLLHRAELLLLRGDWTSALDAAREACARLADPVNLLTIGGAHRLEGDVRRLRGDHEGAETCYELADLAGCPPQPGRALLRAAQGDVEASAGMMGRALREVEDPLSRARLLGPGVEVAIAAGDLDAARTRCEELGAIAHELSSVLLGAYAAHAEGAVAVAVGDTDRALRLLRRVLAAWRDVDVPYEAAQARLLLAEVCEATGDLDGAATERRTADRALRALETGEPLPVGPPPASTGDAAATAGLTAREVEVLLLVARGLSNRDVGSDLFIAEKTVASHLNHIFTKLGLSSRSAATAYAYEHGLL